MNISAKQARIDRNREHLRCLNGYRVAYQANQTCECGLKLTNMGLRSHQRVCVIHKQTHRLQSGTKACFGCKCVFPLTQFWANVRSKDGRWHLCRACAGEAGRRNRELHKEVTKVRDKERYKRRSAILAKQSKDRYRRIMDTAPEKIRSANRIRWKKRVEHDVAFRLLCSARNRLYEVLARTRRPERTVELLGCSPAELKTYLEAQFKPGWTWDDWGSVFEIDHKRPCASFDMTDAAQRRACFHYTNLRPLEKDANRRKWAHWEPKDVVLCLPS